MAIKEVVVGKAKKDVVATNLSSRYAQKITITLDDADNLTTDNFFVKDIQMAGAANQGEIGSKELNWSYDATTHELSITQCWMWISFTGIHANAWFNYSVICVH